MKVCSDVVQCHRVYACNRSAGGVQHKFEGALFVQDRNVYENATAKLGEKA